MEENELNYEAMLKQSFDRLKEQYELQEEFSECLRTIMACNPYITIMTNRLFDMSFEDQLRLLRIMAKNGKVTKELCEKYGWDEETKEEENGNDN